MHAEYTRRLFEYIVDLNQNRLDGMSINRRSSQTTNNRVKRGERLDAPLLVVLTKKCRIIGGPSSTHRASHRMRCFLVAVCSFYVRRTSEGIRLKRLQKLVRSVSSVLPPPWIFGRNPQASFLVTFRNVAYDA